MKSKYTKAPIKKVIKRPKPSVDKVKGREPKKVKKAKAVSTEEPAHTKKPVAGSSNKLPASVQQNTPIATEQPAAWPKMHEKAFPGWIGDFVRHACEHSEADPVAVLMTLILYYAAQIYGVFTRIGDSKQMARTNGVLVGDSSKARKGTSAKPVDRLFSGLINGARKTPGPLSSGPGLIYNVRDDTLEFDKKSGDYKVKEPGIKDKRLFIQDEEFETTLANTKRPGNSLSATIRCFYDDGNAEPLTKTSRISVKGAHVVILAHITKEELTTMLNKVQMANGFGNRFLWLLVKRQKLIAMPKPMSSKVVKRFQMILAKSIEAAMMLKELKMDETASNLWEDSYHGLSMDFSGTVGALVNRSETHAVRLAEIYAMMLGHKMIRTADLEAAMAVVKYSQESVSIIFKGSHEDSRKMKIIQALTSAAKKKLTLTDINVKVFQRNLDSETIQKMLDELKSSKLIIMKKIKSKTGRSKIVVMLTPVGPQQN